MPPPHDELFEIPFDFPVHNPRAMPAATRGRADSTPRSTTLPQGSVGPYDQWLDILVGVMMLALPWVLMFGPQIRKKLGQTRRAGPEAAEVKRIHESFTEHTRTQLLIHS